MKFNQEISISDIISLLALFATFITILQVKLQRKDSNRPYLIIDFRNDYNHSITVTSDEYINGCDENTFDFELKNIGNGIARDVHIDIKFVDIDKIKLDSSLTLSEEVLSIKNDKAHKSMFFRNYPAYFSYLGKNEYKSLKTEFSKNSCVIQNLISYYTYKNYTNSIINLIPKTLVSICYKDIFNKSYTETFSIIIKIVYIDMNETCYNVKLKRVY